MKVIMGGKFDPRWVGECSECGAVVMAEREELTNIIKGKDRINKQDYALETCPACNSEQKCEFYKFKTTAARRSLKKAGYNTITGEKKKEQLNG